MQHQKFAPPPVNQKINFGQNEICQNHFLNIEDRLIVELIINYLIRAHIENVCWLICFFTLMVIVIEQICITKTIYMNLNKNKMRAIINYRYSYGSNNCQPIDNI